MKSDAEVLINDPHCSPPQLARQITTSAGQLKTKRDIHRLIIRLEKIGDVQATLDYLRELPVSTRLASQLEKRTYLQRVRSEVLTKGVTFESSTPPVDGYLPIPGRVAYILHNCLPFHSGGYATRSQGVISGIVAQGYEVLAVSRIGYPFDVFSRANFGPAPEEKYVVGGVPYSLLKFKEDVRPILRDDVIRYSHSFAEALEEWCLINRPEIIHAASFGINGIVAKQVAKRLGIKAVFELRGLHELRTESFKNYMSESDFEGVNRALETQAVVQADWVFTLTSALRDRSLRRGASGSKISLLPNGVDIKQFMPLERDKELIDELGLKDKTIIGYIGSLVDYEGIDLLIEAVLVISHSRKDFHLLVVGTGSYLPRLLELTSELGVSDFVTFVGRVSHSDVNRYYSIIDICPLPRLPLPICEEVSPLKPFEAMAMEKCVVMSSVSAMAEIIDTRDTGVLFTKGDIDSLAETLVTLINDPERRQRIGKNARAWVVENRNWQAITQEVARVYTSLGVHRSEK
jgi:glycosyltransferase involved in cell wall biosynthesis